ncbi:Plus 3 domain [Trypanosoma vivax]|uniref:Serine/threonine-protein phosphatase n=1 Tax=Trypanosoma vivax (strain Y486) TaxID=1055687 RepID=G0TW61_TRYVY|nr:phosphoprotein phosphatase [Trypanosoma vivax]KAH8607274.1 Plus 3 domain [Trypanosoma vivax]CCC48177.1 putative serine/threonine protein phosphatase [Trypanosoma vivax Y486]
MDPPSVPSSPQAPPDLTPISANTNFRAESVITLEMAQAVTVNREKLSDWHHKIRSRLFSLVSGFFVRCRVEDSTDGRALYKVGRIKTLKTDWSVELDLLTTDEILSGRSNTNYDCISNAKLTAAEFNAFISKVPPELLPGISATVYKMEERLRMIETIILTEPAFHGKRREEKRNQETSQTNSTSMLPEKYVFSQNVLLCEDDLVNVPQTVTIVDLLQNAIGAKGVAEPDTPRAGAVASTKSRVFDEAVASNSTMLQLQDMRNYMNSPTQPPVDAARLIETIRRAANPQYTGFNYENLTEFCKLVTSVCNQCREVVAKEPLFVHLKSPITVFGDIHGNFADMAYFLDKVVAFDDITLRYTTSHLLFLGDYVDRGAFSLECVMYLFALKVISPSKVTLLRGNHESPEVNGDMDVYGYSSFKYQCLDKFGRERGIDVWVAVNEVFQFLPVIADIDKKIFCVHGGLPQYSGGEDKRLEILSDPSFPRIPVVQCTDTSNVAQRMMVNDLLWSDPAPPNHQLDKYGFGPNPRGPDIKTFGSRAVDMFCERYNYQYIFRAHQEKADGLRLSDNARVVTIFSTSDYAGHQNGAGCILVANGKMRMAIKKPQRQEPKEVKATLSPRSLSKSIPGFMPRLKRG